MGNAGILKSIAAVLFFALRHGEALPAVEEVTDAGDNTKSQRQIDTSRWLCKLCPYPLGWYGTLGFGPGWVSDSSFGFGTYRALEEKGLFLSLDGEAHFRSEDGRYFDGYGRNLGIDSRRIGMRGGRQGRYELRMAYREIPVFRGFGTQTPFQGVGSEELTLPPVWQNAPTTGGMTALGQSLAGTPLALQRKTLDAGLSLKFVSRWSYQVDYRHEEKDGTRPFGAGVFMINTSHFPAPVDFTTDQFDMSLSFAGDRSQFRLGFFGSEFSNGHASITWQNPFTPVPGTESLQASLEPDNEFYQFNLAGASAPTPKLRLSGRLAVGRMKQDDPFLPGYSINPQFSDLPLPRASLDGRTDTSTLDLAGKLAARVSRKLSLTARIGLDERDNESPVDIYTPVITDFIEREARPNRPYSFERNRFSLELNYRAHAWIRLNAGARYERFERSLQSVAKTKEDSYWGEVAVSRWASAQFRLKLETADRDASPYRLLEDGGPVEHPLQRKFHLVDRERDRALIELDLTPADRLGVSLAWYAAEDYYDRSVVGLRRGEERNLSLDVNYAAGGKVDLYGFATVEGIDADISGAASVGASPWRGTTDDRFLTVGLGINARLSDRVSLGIDYVLSESEGKIAVDSGAGEGPFPKLETDLRNARVHLSYHADTHWTWKVYAEHEAFDSRDWYVDGLGPAGIDAVLTMGPVSPDYSITVVRVLARYDF